MELLTTISLDLGVKNVVTSSPQRRIWSREPGWAGLWRMSMLRDQCAVT